VLQIHLLGRPHLVVDGSARVLRAHKPWALLAYLLLAGRAPSRRALAELLWPEADDPLAAERWALVQVRRALSPEAQIVDSRGSLSVPRSPTVTVDVDALLGGNIELDVAEQVTGGELLEGLRFGDAPEFEQWLLLERHRVASASRDALRWGATLLARSDPERALRLIERGLALDPFDDLLHELAVDVHVMRGATRLAEQYIANVERRYRAELGNDAPLTLRRPLERSRSAVDISAVNAQDVARALLEAAEARLGAGEYAAAEESARRAATHAAATGERALEARALVTLATVLIHGVRGRDREAVGLLTRAVQLAAELGDDRLASEIERENGYIALLSADYGAAEATLQRAIAFAERAHAPGLSGQSLALLGACRSDRGDFAGALRALEEAVAVLERAGDRRWRAFALSFLARAHLRSGNSAQAREMAAASVSEARASGWLSLAPWPMAQLGEAEAREGDRVAARETLARAFALGEEFKDPCWEAIALRGLALLDLEDGNRDHAIQTLEEAHRRCTRVPDTYRWIEALLLTDLALLDPRRESQRFQAAMRLTQRGAMADLVWRLSAAAPRRQTLPQTRAL
jgi:DNA-binding SARP family transcriptional activator